MSYSKSILITGPSSVSSEHHQILDDWFIFFDDSHATYNDGEWGTVYHYDSRNFIYSGLQLTSLGPTVNPYDYSEADKKYLVTYRSGGLDSYYRLVGRPKYGPWSRDGCDNSNPWYPFCTSNSIGIFSLKGAIPKLTAAEATFIEENLDDWISDEEQAERSFRCPVYHGPDFVYFLFRDWGLVNVCHPGGYFTMQIQEELDTESNIEHLRTSYDSEEPHYPEINPNQQPFPITLAETVVSGASSIKVTMPWIPTSQSGGGSLVGFYMSPSIFDTSGNGYIRIGPSTHADVVTTSGYSSHIIQSVDGTTITISGSNSGSAKMSFNAGDRVQYIYSEISSEAIIEGESPILFSLDNGTIKVYDSREITYVDTLNDPDDPSSVFTNGRRVLPENTITPTEENKDYLYITRTEVIDSQHNVHIHGGLSTSTNVELFIPIPWAVPEPYSIRNVPHTNIWIRLDQPAIPFNLSSLVYKINGDAKDTEIVPAFYDNPGVAQILNVTGGIEIFYDPPEDFDLDSRVTVEIQMTSSPSVNRWIYHDTGGSYLAGSEYIKLTSSGSGDALFYFQPGGQLKIGPNPAGDWEWNTVRSIVSTNEIMVYPLEYEYTDGNSVEYTYDDYPIEIDYYFDIVDDFRPPTFHNIYPNNGATNMDRYRSISFDIKDEGLGIDISSLTLTVSNLVVIPQEVYKYSDNWYFVRWTPTYPYYYNTTVECFVTVSDLASAKNRSYETWSFSTVESELPIIDDPEPYYCAFPVHLNSDIQLDVYGRGGGISESSIIFTVDQHEYDIEMYPKIRRSEDEEE